MHKIPISGGPHTGKTTLFNALRAEFADAYFLAEPASMVMDREMKKEQETPAIPVFSHGTITQPSQGW